MNRRASIDVRASAFAGVLVALIVLVGRWSPTRLVGGEPMEFLRPRTWFVAVLVLLSLALPDQTKRPEPRPSTAVGAFAVTLLLWELAAWSWSPDLREAAPKAFEVFLVLVVVTCTFRVLRTGCSVAFQGGLWSTLLVLCGAMAVGAVLSAADGTGRLTVLGGGPNVFGRNMGMLALLSVDRALRWGRIRTWIPIATLALLLVVLSGSRGAMIATAAAMAVLLVASRVRPTTLFAATLGLIAIVVAVLSWTDVGQRAVEFFEQRFILLVVKERYLAGRDALYANALDLLRDSPIMGGGLASFRLLGLGVYPHNLFLEVACDGGAIAVALLLGLLAASVRWAHRAGWSNPPALAIAALYFVAAQVSGDLYDTRTLFVMALLVGLPALQPDRPDPGHTGRNRVIAGGRAA